MITEVTRIKIDFNSNKQLIWYKLWTIFLNNIQINMTTANSIINKASKNLWKNILIILYRAIIQRKYQMNNKNSHSNNKLKKKISFRLQESKQPNNSIEIKIGKFIRNVNKDVYNWNSNNF